MPTPSEDTLPQNTLHESESSIRSSFASCPPEDGRDYHAPRQEEVEHVATPHSQATAEHTSASTEDDEDTEASHEQPPESSERNEETSVSESTQEPESPVKGEHIEDAGAMIEPPSPTIGSPDAPSDSDRLAQSMSSTVISGGSPSPQYLHFPEMDQERVRLPRFER